MNDKEKIDELLHHLRIKATDFAREIKLNNVQTIYDIQSGKIGISKSVFNKITKTFPEISKEWLFSGKGEMIMGDDISQSIEDSQNAQNVHVKHIKGSVTVSFDSVCNSIKYYQEALRIQQEITVEQQKQISKLIDAITSLAGK